MQDQQKLAEMIKADQEERTSSALKEIETVLSKYHCRFSVSLLIRDNGKIIPDLAILPIEVNN